MAHVVCAMNVESDRASFTWSEGPAVFEPYTLDGLAYTEFRETARAAREKLADLVKDYFYAAEHVHQAAYELAEAGHELYAALFDPGADQERQARSVRKWLEKLAREREVDTLEIVVESPWSLPWNIIYDQEPDEESFLENEDGPERWKPFWGLRYNLCGGRKVDPLRRMPVMKDIRVLLVIDPRIRDGLPAAQQQRLAEFVGKHGLKVVQTKEELKAAAKKERPDLLYWLSHASPDALVLSDEPVTPRDLRRLLKQSGDEDYGFGGLAFLNACQTAEGSAEGGSFFEAFHSLGFAGMIGTEHQTIDQFANPLGLDFLEAFLERGEPVGRAMRRLRGRVPLGLLYGTYCPPNIHVFQEGVGKDSVVIDHTGHVGGVVLGTDLTLEAKETRPPPPPLPRDPYPSLAYYERGDRALFAGRDDDMERFASLLDDAGTRLLVLHGESGVGKSSFLHAGVIPFLEEECLGYRFLRTTDEGAAGNSASIMFIRATNDMFGQLAGALCAFCARPYEYETPLGEKVATDLPGVLRQFFGDRPDQASVRAALHSDLSLLGRVLTAISDRLPFSGVLVIDQAEEVFTLAQSREDLQSGRRALDMLRRTVGTSGDYKVILSLRTEYYGRLIDRLRRGLHDTGGIREYLLTDFDEHDLVEAICRPTADSTIPYATEIPFEKYGFRYDAGVAEEIAHRVVRFTTQRRDSVLPLVQVICTQLYGLARQRDDRTITSSDLNALGGIEGGMRKHVEGLLSELLKTHPLDRRPLQRLFTMLYLKQPDGTLTTALLAEDEVRQRWSGRTPFDELLRRSQSLRLLKVDSLRIGPNEERSYVSLGHDALAKLAADWDEELSRGARIRKLVAAITAVSAVALVMAALAVWALNARNEALAAKAKEELAKTKAETAQQEAEANFEMARDAVDKYFTRISEDALLNEPGMHGLRNDLLHEALTFTEKFIRERKNDPSVKYDLARALFNQGRITEIIGPATESLESYGQAQRLQTELAATDPARLEYLRDLSYTWNAIGRAHQVSKQYDEAFAAYQQAVEVRRRLVDKDPKNAEFHRLLASAYQNLGGIAAERAEFELARQYFEQGQEIRRKQLARDPEPGVTALLRRDLGRGHYSLGRLLAGEALRLADSGEESASDAMFDAAQVQVERSIEILSKVLEDDERSIENEHLVTRAFRLLGDVLAEPGLRDQAYAEAQRRLATLVRRNPLVGTYHLDLAKISVERGHLEMDGDHFGQAEQHYQRAADICSQLLHDHAHVRTYRETRASGLLHVAESCEAQGKLTDARDNAVRSLEDWQALLERFPESTVYQDLAVHCQQLLQRVGSEPNVQ